MTVSRPPPLNASARLLGFLVTIPLDILNRRAARAPIPYRPKSVIGAVTLLTALRSGRGTAQRISAVRRRAFIDAVHDDRIRLDSPNQAASNPLGRIDVATG